MSGETEISKCFKIKPGQTNAAGQTTFNVEVNDTTRKNRVSLFVTGADLMRLKIALEAALPLVLGWHR